MRIAFLVDAFPKLSETAILNQITGLLERGQEVDIFALARGREAEVHPDVEKYRLLERTYYLEFPRSKWGRFFSGFGIVLTKFHHNPMAVLRALNVFRFGRHAVSFGLLHRVAPFLGKGPYDIVHCQFGPNGNRALLLRELGAIEGKIITTFRGYDLSSYLHQHGRHVYDRLFARADLICCVCAYMKEKLIKLGCDGRKIRVHRSGVDTKRFTVRPSSPSENGKVRALTIGRLVEKKGVQYGIQAVGALLKQYPQLEYHIVGDGPLREELSRLIASLGADQHITLLGWKRQDEVIDLLQNTDILVAPSVTSEKGDEEGVPGVVMEALACGVPVVSTYHSGIPEVVQDGQSGFLVPERDVGALADKLAYLIAHPRRRMEMGRAGRRYIEKQCDLSTLNDRLVSLYRHVCHSVPAQANSLSVHQSDHDPVRL
jgi:colanic acid/amylovoran biosynthesis glycosyltransferase